MPNLTRRVSQCLLVVGFVLIITTYGWASLLGVEDHTSVRLARPEFPTFGEVISHPYHYEETAASAFPFRKLAVRIHGLISVYLFRDRIVGDQVLKGDDGWLYMADQWELNAYQKVNSEIFTSQTALDSLVRTEKWVRSLGGEFYAFIIPNKTTAYPQHIGLIIPALGSSNDAEALVSENEARSDPVNLFWLSEFLNGDQVLYQRTDTHWNDLGAFRAYEEMLTKLRDPDISDAMLTLDALDVITKTQSGDLTRVIGLSPEYQEDVIALSLASPRAQQQPTIDIGCGSALQKYHIANSDLPTAVIVHDSFGQVMIPYLADSFSTVWFVHFNNCPQALYDYPNIIESVRPDYVIAMFVERDFVRVGLWQTPEWLEGSEP